MLNVVYNCKELLKKINDKLIIMKEQKEIILNFDVAINHLTTNTTESFSYHDRYHVNIPIELFPKELVEIIAELYNKDKIGSKYINNISVCVPIIKL